ncbi:nuclease HARBI1 [Trichonephila clavipes]|nr:nuclease HARBI1 [Trichonephila clavipes]
MSSRAQSEAIASLLPDFIHLPVNGEECKTVSKNSSILLGFQNLLELWMAPLYIYKDTERFCCRKKLLRIECADKIVRADLVIRNVVARWPGSAHDSTVFNNSAACLSLKSVKS